MIPILFESTETSFTTNGIGRLSDAISCIVTEERNGIYELEMQYPITGQYFDELTHSRIIFATPADGKSGQPFRIYRIEKPLNGICTIYAEHISYELAHIPVKPFSATACAAALNGLVTNAGQTCPFTVWTNKSVTANFTLREPRTFRELLGGTQGSILDVYGKGEYEFDKYLVKLYVNRGTDSGVVIRYAKNLTELVNDENIEEVYTGVCPYWASENGTVVMLPEVAIWASTAANFPYKRTKIVDFSNEFEEQPTVAQLRARTNEFIAANDIGIPKVNIDVSFVPLWQTEGASLGSPQFDLVIPGRVEGDTLVDVAGRVEGDTVYFEDAYFEVSFNDYKILERVHLCDTITVQYDALGVSYKAEVIKTIYDVLRDRYESIEVGEPKTTLASIVTDIDSDISRVEAEVTGDDITQRLMEYVDHQTELITGGLGGYVIIGQNANGEPEEILIMDTADKTTATNVIRMNKNGIGFSTTGYSGPFTSAWTIDGIFNTAFIGAGSITGTQIAAGSITGVQIAAGSITAGNLSLYGKMGVYTDENLSTVGGYIGYMSGSTGGATTNGIGIMSPNSSNYLIATNSGVRMTYGGTTDCELYLYSGGITAFGNVRLNMTRNPISGLPEMGAYNTYVGAIYAGLNSRAGLFETDDGRGVVRLWHYNTSLGNAYVGAQMYCGANGYGEVDVYNNQGNLRASLYCTTGNAGALQLKNAYNETQTLTYGKLKDLLALLN
jgi:phage minor structural protein